MSKSRWSKSAFQERQRQIAIERGLIKPDAPVDAAKMRHVMPDETAIRAATARPVQEYRVPELPCPCKEAGLTEGRHKVNGGHCVDGTFWPTSAITTLKHMKALRGGRSVEAEANALATLNKEIGLDLNTLQIIPHVR